MRDDELRVSDEEPGEWNWTGDRFERLEAKDPGWLCAIIYLGVTLTLAAVTWGAVTVIGLVMGRR